MRALRFGFDPGLALALCVVLAFSLCRAEEPSNGQAEQALSGASDTELVDMLSSARHYEPSKVLSLRMVSYFENEQNEQMEALASLLSATLGEASGEEARLQALSLLRTLVRLGRGGSDTAFQAVCSALLEDPHGFIRLEAAETLRRLGRADAIPVLTEAVLDEKNIPLVMGDHSIREAAINALGSCGPEAAPVLLELRSNEKLTTNQRDRLVVSALARTGDEVSALPKVLEIIDGGSVPEVSAAVGGLGGGFRGYSTEAQATIMDVIRAALAHPSRHVREAACNAILYIGEPANIPLLEPLLEDPHMELSRQYDETNTELVEVELYPVRKRAERVLKELHRIAEQRERVAASAASPDRRLHIPSVDLP